MTNVLNRSKYETIVKLRESKEEFKDANKETYKELVSKGYSKGEIREMMKNENSRLEVINMSILQAEIDLAYYSIDVFYNNYAYDDFRSVYDDRLSALTKTLSLKEKVALLEYKLKCKKSKYDYKIYGSSVKTGWATRYNDVLIDLGVSAKYIEWGKINRIYITHMHSDHVNDAALKRAVSEGIDIYISELHLYDFNNKINKLIKESEEFEDLFADYEYNDKLHIFKQFDELEHIEHFVMSHGNEKVIAYKLFVGHYTALHITDVSNVNKDSEILKCKDIDLLAVEMHHDANNETYRQSDVYQGFASKRHLCVQDAKYIIEKLDKNNDIKEITGIHICYNYHNKFYNLINFK